MTQTQTVNKNMEKKETEHKSYRQTIKNIPPGHEQKQQKHKQHDKTQTVQK